MIHKHCPDYCLVLSLEVWLGGVTVASQTGDLEVALPGNDSGQVVYTHVPLFTKQYSLVPVKGRWRSLVGKVTVGLPLAPPDFVICGLTAFNCDRLRAHRLFRVWVTFTFFITESITDVFVSVCLNFFAVHLRKPMNINRMRLSLTGTLM